MPGVCRVNVGKTYDQVVTQQGGCTWNAYFSPAPRPFFCSGRSRLQLVLTRPHPANTTSSAIAIDGPGSILECQVGTNRFVLLLVSCMHTKRLSQAGFLVFVEIEKAYRVIPALLPHR